MESINLGAVLFGLLLFVWLGYAVPRIALRRDVMGHSVSTESAQGPLAVRDLSQAARSHRRAHEVHEPMTGQLLPRSARPQVQGHSSRATGSGFVSATPAPSAAPSRAAMRALLLGLAALVVLTAILSLAGALPGAVPLVALALLVAYVVLLRRAELRRREHAQRLAARQERTRRLSAPVHARAEEHARPAAVAATAAEPATPAAASVEEAISAAPPVVREWTPRPVPRPAYSLRGEVDDLASRHRRHRDSIAFGGFEAEDVEDREARTEDVAALEPASELDLDAVLARRRGA